MITRTLKTLVALLAATTTVIANPITPERTIFDHFLQAEILEATLETDLAELIENRRTEEYLPAIFTFEDASGKKYSQEIKVKPRGRFRRRACNFPPLMLNFSKGQLKDEGYLPEYDKLKLVTHCLDDKAQSKEQVMKEFLAYKLYNELTDQSYRVQLAKITYVDTKGKVGKIKRYGFIIEDTDEMAHRLGGEECEDCHGLASSDNLALDSENLMAVFQYMIGNTDWSINMVRNVKMVSLNGGEEVVPVPYDFDFSGLVNAPYAIPNSELGQLSIRQRVFQGNDAERPVFERTLKHFLAKRVLLVEAVEQFRELSWESRRDIINYLDTFFRDAELILEGAQPQDTSLQKAIREQLREEARPASAAETTLGK